MLQSFILFDIFVLLKLTKELEMKFCLDVTIPQVVEQHYHGVIEYKAVELNCCISTGDTLINQGEDSIILNEDQAQQLYLHLKQVFGE